MNNTLNNKERVQFMNIVAEKEFEIEQLAIEKNEEIAYWKKRYELCMKHRMHERHERTVKWQDRITGAVLAICCSGAFWLCLRAFKEFLLWASGQ